MKLKYLLAASVVSLSVGATFAAPTAAQQITSGIEGTVSSSDGTVLPGAVVTVTDTRTNQARTLNTGPDGTFRAGNLVPGGPYQVTVVAEGYEGQTVLDQFITVSGNLSFDFELSPVSTGDTGDVIVVTGARAGVSQLAVGPGTAFGAETLENFPSITRDVRDIIRLDPRVSIDRDNEVDRVSCLGGNDRSNTFTVDGIVQADVFGLNGTPFASRNSLPLPFDVIRETSVEFAPFDVEYSDFTGCLVNVVTKSGTNEFHGGGFFTFRNENLRGDTIDGDDFTAAEFEEKRWGATLNGPIIRDRLFFSFGYEETDLGDTNDTGPQGLNFPNAAEFVDADQFNRFASIASSVYGQDVGEYPRALPESSQRYFGRIDAYITDDHRLEATYQKLKETNVESDAGFNELTGVNSFEDEGTDSDYYAVRLYSNWTDSFATELRVSRADVSDVQGPFGFGEAQSENPTVRLVVGVQNTDPDGNLVNGFLSTGPGIFRSANALQTRIDQARFQATADVGNHQFKAGVEVNDLEVYNLFATNATGTLFFRNLEDFQNGIVADGNFSSVFSNPDALANGTLGGGVISATPTGDINEAAATFNRTIYSFYAQDEWQATDQLSLTAGIRAQLYAGSAPAANPTFFDRYGFSNRVSFSGIPPVILPRVAATYEFDNDGLLSNSRVTGGVGIFAGGDPVVFFSNAFSNNGFNTGEGTTFTSACDAIRNADGTIDILQGGSFNGFPECARLAGSNQAARGLADTQSTDPDFKIPTVLRANLGFATRFGTDGGFFSDWQLNLDYIYSRFQNTLNFVDLAQVVNPALGADGFTVDGRPIYRAIDPTANGCDALLQDRGGTPPVYTNVGPACFATGRDDELQLTNGPDYESHVASIALAKNLGRGFLTDNGDVGFRLGYAYTDSENNRNIGSSTATSNFDVTAAFDRQDPAISTSNFETKHNFTAAISLREAFFEDYQTSLGLFFSARSGRPYSLTFANGGDFNDSASGNNNALLYVPTGVDDSNLAPPVFNGAGQLIGGSDPEAVQALVDYVAASGCDFTPGQSIARNTCENDWYYDLDMRISQELPFIGRLTGIANDRIELFADFDNFLNLLDNSWNVFRRRGGFSQTVDVVEAGASYPDPARPGSFINVPAVDNQGRYVISDFDANDENTISSSASVWRIQVGVRYQF